MIFNNAFTIMEKEKELTDDLMIRRTDPVISASFPAKFPQNRF